MDLAILARIHAGLDDLAAHPRPVKALATGGADRFGPIGLLGMLIGIAGVALIVGAEYGRPVSGGEVTVKLEDADLPRVRQRNAKRLVVVEAGQWDLGASQHDARLRGMVRG